VAQVIDRALVLDRARRFANTAEFGSALLGALEPLEREVGLDAPLQALVAELNRPGDAPARRW
jgi:hypothetical protein